MRWGIVISAFLMSAGCGSSSGLRPSDGGRIDADARMGQVSPAVDAEGDEASDVPGAGLADAPAVADVQGVDRQDANSVDVAAPQDVATPGDAAVLQDAPPGRDASGSSDALAVTDVCTIGVAYRSPLPILAVLPTRTGLVVVQSSEVVLASRGGAVLRRLAWSREILSASWSAERAVILDRAVLTTLDDRLEMLGHVNLVESCVQAVAANAGRIVCGPANDWQRIFYTYEVATPALVARSEGFTYEGIPMRGVPGRPWFLTQESLFGLGATGAAQTLESLRFGTTTGGPMLPLAFAGNPAGYAVDRLGKVFQLQETCQPTCFVNRGAWTTSVYGLIDGPSGTVIQPGVTGAKRLDAQTGAVISTGRVNIDAVATVSAAVYDPFCGAVSTTVDRYSDGPVRSVEQVPYDGADGGV